MAPSFFPSCCFKATLPRCRGFNRPSLCIRRACCDEPLKGAATPGTEIASTLHWRGRASSGGGGLSFSSGPDSNPASCFFYLFFLKFHAAAKCQKRRRWWWRRRRRRRVRVSCDRLVPISVGVSLADGRGSGRVCDQIAAVMETPPPPLYPGTPSPPPLCNGSPKTTHGASFTRPQSARLSPQQTANENSIMSDELFISARHITVSLTQAHTHTRARTFSFHYRQPASSCPLLRL